MQTDIIKYNLTDRGRKYRGQDRHFNIAAVVAAINGPECQERVRKRDMLGYYGHWPRLRFGMLPAEGGLDGGNPALVEPAIVTTYLKAHDDGTIEHRAEFLGTDSGKVAAKLYEDHVGGFSSAIVDSKANTVFYGFDYVLEPNYSTNRGWQLDSVTGRYFDSVGAEVDDATLEAVAYGEQVRTIKTLMDSVASERALMESAMQKLREENDQLIDELTTKRKDDAVAELDSVIRSNCTQEYERMKAAAAAFDSVKTLPKLKQEEERLSVESVDKNPLYARFMHQF